MKLIEAALKDDAFLDDVRGVQPALDEFALWWLGQSGFLVKFRGSCFLFDPYLSDSLTKKYETTDKPHVRMTERVVDPGRLDFIDFVTSSHNHTDHLDAETLVPLMDASPRVQLIAPEKNRDFVADRLCVDRQFPIGLRAGESVNIGDFTIHAVPAAHEDLAPQYLGYVVRFGRWSIYHSGDTVLYEGMAETLRSFAVDVALLPINGRAPERRVAGNLNAREAAQLGKDIAARLVIPCHYDMFAFNTADPRDFEREAQAVGQHYRVLRNGERWMSESLAQAPR